MKISLGVFSPVVHDGGICCRTEFCPLYPVRYTLFFLLFLAGTGNKIKNQILKCKDAESLRDEILLLTADYRGFK